MLLRIFKIYQANLNVEIVDNDEPGGGKKVTLIDPEGLEIEIYYGINEIDPKSKHHQN